MPPEAAERPTVSLVIPVKDDSAELAVCLSHLQAQTRPADEIIVVDNGSSDSSAGSAASGGARVLSCPYPGIPAASSRGYDAARGAYILRLDADCVPPPRWIEDVVKNFQAHPEASAVTGPARFYDGPVLLRVPLARLYLLAYTLASAAALGHRPLFGSNLAMRREAWEAIRTSVHRDDPELHDDLDLSFHLGQRHRIRYLKAEAMGISIRPFLSARSFSRRILRGFYTVGVHWPHDFPPYRWRRVMTSRRRPASES